MWRWLLGLVMTTGVALGAEQPVSDAPLPMPSDFEATPSPERTMALPLAGTTLGALLVIPGFAGDSQEARYVSTFGMGLLALTPSLGRWWGHGEVGEAFGLTTLRLGAATGLAWSVLWSPEHPLEADPRAAVGFGLALGGLVVVDLLDTQRAGWRWEFRRAVEARRELERQGDARALADHAFTAPIPWLDDPRVSAGLGIVPGLVGVGLLFGGVGQELASGQLPEEITPMMAAGLGLFSVGPSLSHAVHGEHGRASLGATVRLAGGVGLLGLYSVRQVTKVSDGWVVMGLSVVGSSALVVVDCSDAARSIDRAHHRRAIRAALAPTALLDDRDQVAPGMALSVQW